MKRAKSLFIISLTIQLSCNVINQLGVMELISYLITSVDDLFMLHTILKQ